jgi:hypothetical protein
MTEQNKQPPTGAGECAVAIVDADAPCGIALTDAGAKLPIGTHLYTSQSTATQAAVATALLKVREGLRIAGIRMGLAGEELEFFISDTLSAFIPVDQMQALRKFGIDVLRTERNCDPFDGDATIVDRLLTEKGLK